MKEKLLTKNFLLLLLGQASSLFGNFILRLALSMYVLEVTGSAAVFAGLLSAAVIPTILLSPFGGILADRADRRSIMVALDTLTGLSVLCVVFFLNERSAVGTIGILLAALSVFGAFETPTVQACVPQMLSGDNIIKGNALINQVASVSYLIAPMLGGVLYAAFGLKPLMLGSILCFFLTAFLECFIKLDCHKSASRENIWSVVKNDFSDSIHFLAEEQTGILKMLLLVALSRFFVMGLTVVGLPYLIRNVLELGAGYYGAAESAQAVAIIIGSIAAGLLAGRMNMGRLPILLAVIGAFIIPGGIAFLFPLSAAAKYIMNVGGFCGMQIAVNLFSIFAVSLIQQNTPNQLLGKVMAFTSAVTMCVQPIGQIVYGFLFDEFCSRVYLILIPTGVIVCVIGLLSMGFLKMNFESGAVPFDDNEGHMDL